MDKEQTSFDDIFASIKEKCPHAYDKVLDDWGCTTCASAKQLVLECSDIRAKGVDVHIFLNSFEENHMRRHAGHESFNHKNAEVFFIQNSYGFSINQQY